MLLVVKPLADTLPPLRTNGNTCKKAQFDTQQLVLSAPSGVNKCRKRVHTYL